MRTDPFRFLSLAAALLLSLAACDDTVSPAATLLQVRGTVWELYEDSVPVPDARVLVNVLAPAGDGVWASDSTDADGRYAVELWVPTVCEAGDSLGAVIKFEALDFRTEVHDRLEGRSRLACDPEPRTLDEYLYREVFRTPLPVAGSPVATQLSAGHGHTCTVTSTGTYCWGQAKYGELGAGEEWLAAEYAGSPVPVVGGERFTHLAAGFDHTCGLDGAGAAWCWGFNIYGAVGVDTAVSRGLVPEPVRVETDLRFVELVTGRWHTCGLTAAGDVYCWGDGRGLGNGSFDIVTTPTRVLLDGRFVQISSEFSHTCALQDTGDLYCWGFNYAGELGGGEPWHNLVPARVAGDHEWGMVSAGNVYTCALTTAGAAYCWGRDLGGRLGRGGSASGDVGTPTPVAGGYTFAEIRADWHTCAWTADGMAYCWGDNEHGELGVPADATECESPYTTACTAEPTPVSGALQFSAVQGGYGYTCGITTNQRVYCWGLRKNLGSGKRLLE